MCKSTYEGCRPECVLSSDCPSDKACIRNKCKDPCPGVCGLNAECSPGKYFFLQYDFFIFGHKNIDTYLINLTLFLLFFQLIMFQLAFAEMVLLATHSHHVTYQKKESLQL